MISSNLDSLILFTDSRNLHWSGYSYSLDSLIAYYEKAIEEEDGFPEEALFYLISKKILEIKRKKPSLFLSGPSAYLYEFEQSNIPLLFLLKDGQFFIS